MDRYPLKNKSNRFQPRRHIRLPLATYRGKNCFFVTIATHERYPWFERHPNLSHAVGVTLQATAKERHGEVYAWCLMPDHVHILVGDADIVEFVRLIKGRATPLARRLEPKRRLWQRSFHDHVLRRQESLEEVAKYIFENPVRAGLAESPDKYPWSGSTVWPDWRTWAWA